MRPVVVVPSAPALLGEYAGQVDPFPDLRRAVTEAVSWLVGSAATVAAVGRDDLARRIAHELAGPVPFTTLPGPLPPVADGLLVVADGTARRTEKAPGHYDPRSAAYDEVVGKALSRGDLSSLAGLDLPLGEQLLASGAPVLAALKGLVSGVSEASVDYDDAPFGVQYWVVRWQCES